MLTTRSHGICRSSDPAGRSSSNEKNAQGSLVFRRGLGNNSKINDKKTNISNVCRKCFFLVVAVKAFRSPMVAVQSENLEAPLAFPIALKY